MKLTFPEPVTETNFREMQQAVVNGPGKYPGATAVIDENGHTTVLREADEVGRLALSKTLRNNEKGLVKVLRHLRDGDAVLVNRQPSLHKPSIMAHIVRVLRTEKTIRMHYANCDAYNADFDGDEMNIHFPQSDLARAEAYTIALGDEQYIVPTDGSPLRGLIQDHVVMGSLLTNKDTMLTREEFQQLLYAAISTLPPTRGSVHLRYQTPIITVPPCIIKPVPLWSGKQVVRSHSIPPWHAIPCLVADH
jgi:DNA-directed RNA polymerase I subunit RPA1